MIIDAFTFFNEKELVELRIKYLSKLIDYFVIIEADVTHTGKEKKWNFPDILNTSLKEFSHKIQYHKFKVDLQKAEAEKNPNYKGKTWGRSWKIESMQRNYIQEACREFSANDIIIISDLDEIPSKDKINFIKSSNFKEIAPVAFGQSLFHLNCNYLNMEKWIGSIAVTKELIDKYEPQIFRDNRSRISHITEAGWSFSSFGGIERVREKFAAFCHEEFNKNEYLNESHLKKCIEAGTDLLNRKVERKKVEKSFFPNDLVKLMEENSPFYFG